MLYGEDDKKVIIQKSYHDNEEFKGVNAVVNERLNVIAIPYDEFRKIKPDLQVITTVVDGVKYVPFVATNYIYTDMEEEK